MLGLVLVLWAIVYKWILDNVRARTVYIDEKWLKIRGRWRYWFVVLDTETGLPVLAALLQVRLSSDIASWATQRCQSLNDQ